MKLLVFIQQENNSITRSSLEALVGAQKIAKTTGATITAVIFGNQNIDQINHYHCNELLIIDNPELNSYNPLNYTSAIHQIIKSENADIFILSHTYEARDWVARVSARMDIPFISDAIGFKNDNELLFIRQIFQGKINSDLAICNLPGIVSFQPGSFIMDDMENGNPTVRNMLIDLTNVPNSIRVGELVQESTGEIDLSSANVIVSVGRGIGKEENIPIIRELASVLNAELGASRPIVDYEWLAHERQVGTSGQTVSPKLYLAIGISGAVQHQVGMKNSDNIVAINKDKNAPIFEVADYGIVANLFDIIPKLTEAIREKQ